MRALGSSGTWNWVVQAVLSPHFFGGCVSDLPWLCGGEGLRELASFLPLLERTNGPQKLSVGVVV